MVVAGSAVAGSPRGVGFELKRTSVSPKHPLYDAKREVTLHYGFSASRPTDLQIRVVKVKSGNVVRVFTERDAQAGTRLKRPWNGLTRRGKAADDGRYEFRAGPKGGATKFAGRFRLRTHVFPVDGPHGTRGAIGESAPRAAAAVPMRVLISPATAGLRCLPPEVGPSKRSPMTRSSMATTS